MSKNISQEKRQTIMRVIKDKEHPYVIVPKEIADDSRLTWQARGLMTYLIGRPNDWTIIVTHLVKQAKNGKDSLMSIIRELKQAGYIQHYTFRYKGKICFKEYQVYEKPAPDPEPKTIYVDLQDAPFTEDAETIDNKESSPETDFPALA